MKKYKIKFRPERVGGSRIWGFDGHKGPRSLEEVVQLIREQGVQNVQYVQHYDENPTNKKRLDGKEMLSLWKAVAM